MKKKNIVMLNIKIVDIEYSNANSFCNLRLKMLK